MNPELEIISAKEIQSIQMNLIRLSEKTQILVPIMGRHEIVRNRYIHSQEVANSGKMMLANITIKLNKVLVMEGKKPITTFDLDYQYILEAICKLHDIGHPPFGHDGAEKKDIKFKSLGLKEGFSDNNNNLKVIEFRNIKVRDCVKVNLIKYPNDLYEDQQHYKEILKKEILKDIEQLKKIGIDIPTNNLNLDNMRGLMCQIMDEADRNTYTCTDLTDFFNLSKTKPTESELKECVLQINLKNITKKAKKENRELTEEEIENSKKINIVQNIIIKELSELQGKGVSEVQNYFENKMELFNSNFRIKRKDELLIDANSLIIHEDENLYQVRELFSDITYEMFIKPIRKQEFHLNNMELLELFINKVIDEQFTESSKYKEKIKEALDSGDKIAFLRLSRDMIAETTDWYIIRKGNELTEGLDQTIEIMNMDSKKTSSSKPKN